MCQNVVEENIRQLRQKDDELRDTLSKMESSEEVNIDEVIQPSTPLYKQSVVLAVAMHSATNSAELLAYPVLKNVWPPPYRK